MDGVEDVEERDGDGGGCGGDRDRDPFGDRDMLWYIIGQ